MKNTYSGCGYLSQTSTPMSRCRVKTFLLQILFLLFFLPFSFSYSYSTDIEILVVGENNEPLIGANVTGPTQQDGTYKFAGITDFDGKIIIRHLALRDTVQISYTGYNTLKKPLYKLRNQFKEKGKIRLDPTIELTEIEIVGATKFSEKERNIPSVVQAITAKEIALSNPQNTAEVLEDGGQVYVQRTQSGGGSPVIRGFEANKVLIVLDGVRMNNAIYRNGHLQSILTVDNAALERAEVVFGPAAVIYGSDALGGVLALSTKDPKLKFNRDEPAISETGFFTRYSTVNDEKTAHLDLMFGGEQWGSFSSFTYSDFNFVRAGSRKPIGLDSIPDNWLRNEYIRIQNGDDIIVRNQDPLDQRAYNLNLNTQTKTGYSQIDFIQKIKYKPSNDLIFTMNFQFSNSSDIPRYDQLTARKSGKLKFAEWHYDPQVRKMLSLRADIFKENRFFNKGIITAAYQHIEEDRIRRKRNSRLRERQREDVYVGSLNLDFKKAFDNEERSKVSYGLEYTYNYVDSNADIFDIRSKERYPAVTRYPGGGSISNSLAAYTSYSWRNEADNLNLIGGLRFTNYNLTSNFNDDVNLIEWPFQKIELNNRNRLTGSVGLTFTPNQWRFRTLVSSAFRTPNVDDLSKIRIKDGFITVPNPELSHEYAYTGEVTIGREFGKQESKNNVTYGTLAKISTTGFYTLIDNAIVRKPTSYVIDGEERTTIIDETGEEQIMIGNTNAASAFIYGISGNFDLDINSNWHFDASVSFTKGRYTSGITEQDTLLPLSHIPPLYGKATIGYKLDKWNLEGVVKFNAKKPIEEYDPTSGNSDNLDEAVEGFGTPAWVTYNLYSSYQLSKAIQLNIGVENILDLHYRTFASGVSAPGRNFVVTVRGNF